MTRCSIIHKGSKVLVQVRDTQVLMGHAFTVKVMVSMAVLQILAVLKIFLDALAVDLAVATTSINVNNTVTVVKTNMPKSKLIPRLPITAVRRILPCRFQP